MPTYPSLNGSEIHFAKPVVKSSSNGLPVTVCPGDEELAARKGSADVPVTNNNHSELDQIEAFFGDMAANGWLGWLGSPEASTEEVSLLLNSKSSKHTPQLLRL